MAEAFANAQRHPSTDMDSPVNWGMKTIMLCGGVLAAMAMMAITAVLPQIESALAITAQDKMLVKLLVSIVGLTMVVGAPLAGFLVDRVGLRRVLIACCILYSLAGTAGLYLDSLPALLASRLLVGLTAAGIISMSITLINTRLQGVERARWMGRSIAVSMGATIVIYPVAGYLGGLGWRWPFALYGLGLLLAIIALAGLDDLKPSRSSRVELGKAAGLLSWFPFRYAILSFLIGVIVFVPMVYIPFVIRDTGVIKPTSISMVMLADSVVGALVALLFGRSQRYLSSVAAFIVSFSCTAVGMLIVATASDFVIVVAGLLVFGLGTGWLIANLMTSVARHVDASRQGRAVGILKGANFLAAPLGTVLVEPLTRSVGPQGAMWLSALLSLLVLCAFVSRRASRRSAPVQVSTAGVSS